MEFLNDIAQPQSIIHYKLVVFVVAVSSMIFFPYMGFVLGSLFMSIRLRIKALREKNATALDMACRIAVVPLRTKSMPMFLGVIPGVSLVLSFAQIMQATPAISVTAAGFGFLFTTIGLGLLYSYKESFRVQIILSSYHTILKTRKGGSAAAENVERENAEKVQTSGRSGAYGIVLLLVGLFLLSAAFTLAADPLQWKEMYSIFDILFSFAVWIKFSVLLALAAGITGFGIQYFIISKSIDVHEAPLPAVKKTCLRLTVTALLVLPLMLLIQVANVNDTAISGPLYSFTGITLVLFFLSAHLLYGDQRSAHRYSAAGGFYTFLLAAGLTLVAHSLAIGTATRGHAAFLSSRHEKNIEDLKANLGINIVAFTGESIYNDRCSACHLFDQKKIGPPYFETIPKYQGKKAELVSFILNPVKKSSDYPPMPNQGLRPAEADSIASYLLQKISNHLSNTSK
jgi:cytochrome c